MSHNLLTSLRSAMFAGLTSLQTLHLSDNRLSGQLGGDLFVLTAQLTQLSLAHNALTSVASDAFASVRNLQSVDLSRNSISTIGPGWLTPLEMTLSSLNVSGNQLTAFTTTLSAYSKLEVG